ncbi:hypothetical protein DL96DRAFT_1618719 [Flagelloscypha sp. PMI_526]|nr:hypothetical protein DL96DRAFT_1618719 [Flagelloscypha sp. PMI_526]
MASPSSNKMSSVTETMTRAAELPATSSPIASTSALARQRFVAELSQCLFDFVIQLLPTAEEMSVKEDVRKLLERLIRTIEPNSRLLSFGSTANGFSLRNSDMDLCCLIDSQERLNASDLVTMVGDLLERETKFHVKPLPHARIPIVKLSLDPSPGLPLGIACDIGFENRLALENTRLLMCYAMIDPTRVRTLVLFRAFFSRYTLSSYGYVLMVIYFLVHVKNPPVLPNLQSMPPLRPISKEDTHVGGHNTWFFDDIELLRQHWHSENTETVAELLMDFFRYYSREFPYTNGVASIRAGSMKKDTKGWQNDMPGARYADTRERNRFCIEDPFETDFNVARCVTKDGLYTIRGEFMRASRILAARPDRAIFALAELCEERKADDLVPAPLYTHSLPRPPPQTPYTVGSRPIRGEQGAIERLSPPKTAPAEIQSPQAQKVVSIRPPPPEHMAPKRGNTSSAHALFEDKLGHGLELATANTDAREHERLEGDSSNSEIEDDIPSESDAASDDVTSIRSFTEGVGDPESPPHLPPQRRPSWLTTPEMRPVISMPFHTDSRTSQYGYIPQHGPHSRGRYYRQHALPQVSPSTHIPRIPPFLAHQQQQPMPPSTPSKRSSSGPPRTMNGPGGPWLTPVALSTPLPPSPESPSSPNFHERPQQQASTVFYQTTRAHLYPGTANNSSPPQLHQHYAPHYQHIIQHLHHEQQQTQPYSVFPPNLPPLAGYQHQQTTLYSSGGRAVVGVGLGGAGVALEQPPSQTPTPNGHQKNGGRRDSSGTVVKGGGSPRHSPRSRRSTPQSHSSSSSPRVSPMHTTVDTPFMGTQSFKLPVPVPPDPTNVPLPLSPPSPSFSSHTKNDSNIPSSSPPSSTSTSTSSEGYVTSTSSEGYVTSISRSPSPSLSRDSSEQDSELWPTTPPVTATPGRMAKEYSESLDTLRPEGSPEEDDDDLTVEGHDHPNGSCKTPVDSHVKP